MSNKHAKLDAFVNDLVSDPDKYRKEWDAQVRKEHPEMTEEQLDWSWRQLASQMGL